MTEADIEIQNHVSRLLVEKEEEKWISCCIQELGAGILTEGLARDTHTFLWKTLSLSTSQLLLLEWEFAVILNH